MRLPKVIFILQCIMCLLIGFHIYQDYKLQDEINLKFVPKESLINTLTIHGNALLIIYKIMEKDPFFSEELKRIREQNELDKSNSSPK